MRDSGCTFENSELCSPAFESKQEHLNQHFLKPFFFLPAKLQILSSLPGVVPFPYLELNARAARHSRRQLPSTTSLTVSSWLYWSTLNPLDRSSRIRGVFFLWEMFRWEVPETLTWASTCVFGRGFFGTFRYDFFLLLGVSKQRISSKIPNHVGSCQEFFFQKSQILVTLATPPRPTIFLKNGWKCLVISNHFLL